MTECVEEIPESVMEESKNYVQENFESGERWSQTIARAILAERQRCADLARSWQDTAKKLGQAEAEGIADDIASVIEDGIPSERQRDQWKPIGTAPKDGTIVNVVGRYEDATAGHPRYAGFYNGHWYEYSRFAPQRLVCWAWRKRDEWPREA